MSTKNTAKTGQSDNQLMGEWQWLFKWLFILGGVVAGVTNMYAFQNEFLITALMVVGILVGLFYFNSDDLINIGLRYLIFTAVANSVGGFYVVGPYVNGFLTGFAYYLGPIVLTLVIVYFFKKYLLSRA